jgi:hypothetical protein
MSGNIITKDAQDLLGRAVGKVVEWDVVGKDGRRFGTIDGKVEEAKPGHVRISGMWCRLQDLPNLRIKTPQT